MPRVNGKKYPYSPAGKAAAAKARAMPAKANVKATAARSKTPMSGSLRKMPRI